MSQGKGLALALLVSLTGCRTATHVVDVPRVDLELSGGNRGYLLGTPPAPPALKTERRMIETDIEVPAFGTATRPAVSAAPTGAAPLTSQAGAEESVLPAGGEGAPVVFDVYTVKKNDTLWSIAADPAVLGDAAKWRLLYNANRDVLKSPDRLRPGMTLKIPRGAKAAGPSAPSALPAEQPTTGTK